MGILSFVIGFFIGEAFLSRFVGVLASKFIAVDVGGICLLKIPLIPWCLFGLGYVGIITGLVVGVIFYIIFK